jgi:hypothetical protein
MWLGLGLDLATRRKGHPLLSDLPYMPRHEDERISSGGPDGCQLPC